MRGREKPGNRLRTLRHDHRLSLADVASDLDVTIRTVSRWETGESPVRSLEHRQMVAHYYDRKLERLFDPEGKIK